MNLPSPDDVSYLLSQPLVALYWPLIVGGAISSLLMVKGMIRACFLVALAFVGVQAWVSGAFG